MKVLFVCEDFTSHTVVAQPWRHIQEIAKRMKLLGHEVKIITDLVNDLPRNELIEGIPVKRVEKGLLFFNHKKLVAVLNEDGVDVINWFGGPLSALYFRKFKGSMKKNIVWNMFKGKLTSEDFSNLSAKELLSLIRNVQVFYLLVPNYFIKKGAMSPKVTSIVVWSNRLKEYLQNIGVDGSKITIISSGVDAETYKPASNSEVITSKKQLGFNQKDSIVLYFGAASTFRGLDVLVSAMNKVSERDPNAKLLVLARDAEMNKTQDALRAARNQENIRVISGIQSQSNIIQFLSIANVVVLPFKSWPHQEVPLTILEAMSMKKTVISTKIMPILEIVEDGKTGILVPPNKADLLAQQIIEVLSNPKVSAEIGAAARAYVEKHHSWDAILNSTLKIFEASKTQFNETLTDEKNLDN